MVSISTESAEQIEARLVEVISEAEFVVHDGFWQFEESAVPPILTAEVLAVVRDEDVWSSLVPAPTDTARSAAAERFGLFSFHFPHAADNSGFVGWLASHLKHELGTGVFVVCGSNTSRGGIFDYWGCPDSLLDEAVAVVERLRSRAVAT
ncbi:hypothetical protein C8K30_108276 [Promicromonospora sp. AC04]|uniref:DUF6196 family protein n=1 Tax=Promicromonospora sp. AC04 TaxID=2135723 RepID=UPI000D39B41B|nr:DUF6196 family protein [Promicromonospora sp. AC04]PUB25019.1 hypothetical protein C8K30_108276 [Promicromonospora sp. AC04]